MLAWIRVLNAVICASNSGLRVRSFAAAGSAAAPSSRGRFSAATVFPFALFAIGLSSPLFNPPGGACDYHSGCELAAGPTAAIWPAATSAVMAANGRPPRSACLAKIGNARATFRRQRLEMAPPPLFLFVHRTLIPLQPQDEIAQQPRGFSAP